MTTPVYDQDAFRFRDGDPAINANGAGDWLELINVDPSSSSDVGTQIRLRFLIQETAGGMGANQNLQLEYNKQSEGWNNVTASSSVIQVTAASYAEDATTTQLLGGGTYVTGEALGADDVDGVTGNIDFAGNDECEAEFSFIIVGADVNHADTILLRIASIGYTNTPTITVNKVVGEIQQSHFRIRNIGGLQTINQDSDWAAAIDVDATLDAVTKDGGCLFGLRIELEEVKTVSAPKTVIPKLQGRVNAGTWTDLRDVGTIDDYVTPGNSTGIYNIIVVNKATITDGAATTNILSGSSKTFVAGTGEHNTIGASIALNNEHTEIEWRVLIRNRYNAPSVRQESIDGDEYEFRVVESDNTILDGTYVIPKITLNLPAGYIGGCSTETSQNRTFIRIPDGTLYAPIESAEIGADVVMLKSIDGGDSWLQQDDTAAIGNDMESWSMAYDDTNKVIHCVQISGGADYYQYATKDHATVPDTWITGNTAALEASVDSINQSCECVIRGTTVYAFYPDLSTTDQVWYRKKADLTTGIWAARISIDTTGSTTDFSGIAAVLGPNSDLIHLFYNDYSNATLYHRSLNVSDTLGTIHTVETDMPTSNDSHMGTTNALSWYNGSNEKAIIGYIDQTNNYLYTVIVQDDGTPDARQLASNSVTVLENPVAINSRQPVASLALDGNDVWALYSNLADADLYRTSNADGAGWGTPVEETDAITNHSIRGQVFTNAGGDTILGYIWDTTYNQDAATPRSGFTGGVRYDEYVIAVGGGGAGPIPASRRLRQRRSALLRM